MSSLLAALTALAPVAVLILQYYLSSRPAAAARSQSNENIRIHNEVADHDVAALRARLAGLRRQSP